MSNNQKDLEAQAESYRRNILEDQLKERYIYPGILNKEQIERYLQNGLELKESGIEEIDGMFIQVDLGSVDNPIHHLIYHLRATLNPQTDINDEGYVTQAWFDMFWIEDIKEQPNGEIKAFMTVGNFRLDYPIKCFRCYVDENEKCLLPLP